MNAILTGLIGLTFAAAAADSPAWTYDPERRAGYVQSLLESFADLRASDVQNTRKYLRAQNRYACASPIEQLRVQCLIEQAKASCASARRQGPSCDRVSDVVASNLIEEKTFLTRHDLLRILRNKRGGNDPVGDAMNGRYARLTVEFLARDRSRCEGRNWACLAREIDRFCAARSMERELAYQGCAGAIVWFVGSQSTGEKR